MKRFAAVLALALGGCATMSKEDCASADWTSIGERDGLYGEALEKFTARRDQCAKFGVASSEDDYSRGRDRGLRAYCTPEAGFDAGRNGRPYRGVCAPETEAAFLSEYKIGRQLYDLTQAVTTAQNAYNGALTDIDDAEHRLEKARKRLNADDATDKDRAAAAKDLEDARKTIKRRRDLLPSLETDLRTAQGRLDDFRQFLDRNRPRG